MAKEKIELVIPTIRRLPTYLYKLKLLSSDGIETISTVQLAKMCALNPIVVKKDIAHTKVKGKPKVGHNVNEIIAAIEEFLGWHNRSDAFIVGMGDLGKALTKYSGFDNYGLRIIAGFDSDQSLVGGSIGGVKVFDIDELHGLISRLKIEMLILTVPAKVAQKIAEIAVSAGVRGIWNFTPTKLHLPDNIIVQKVDIAAELAVLSAKLFHSSEEEQSE